MNRLPATRRKMKRLRGEIQATARLEEEPKDLRVTRGRHGMEQLRTDTNGCEGGATVLTVLNHADLSQAPRVAVKSAPDIRGTRHNMAVKRPRRHTPAVSPPAPVPVLQSSSPPERRRITRHTTPSPIQPEKKAIKSAPNRRNALSVPSSAPSQSAPSPSSLAITSLAEITPLSNSRPSRQHAAVAAASNFVSKKREVKHRPEPLPVDSDLVRASKRMRLQYQPFQSPTPPSVIPAILRNTAQKVSADDKILVFQRGDFLAIRNETGGFYVCRTAQNVYKSSKRFKIQWMDNDSKPELYTPDFFDSTDFECILTNLRMRRIDKNKYILPIDEKQRTLNILQRALNVENGMDVPDLLQVTKDGVDVSFVGKEDDDVEPRPKKQNVVKTIASNLRGRGRPRKSSQSDSPSPERTPPKEKRKQPKTAVMKVRAKARERARGKTRTTPALILSVKKGQPATVRVKKAPSEELRLNSKVIVFEKDPTFETNLPIPFISTTAHSRLLIRAVLMSDMTLLQALLADTKNICSLTVSRSLHLSRDALTYAVLRQDHHMIRALLSAKQRKYASSPDILLTNEETGRSNMAMFGHHVYNVNVGRGGREGNNAFLKDRYHYSLAYPTTNNQISIEALSAGVSMDTIGALCQGNLDTRDFFYHDIIKAVRNGHHKIAGELVKEAFEKGGHGFNFLHKEVLLNDKQPLSKFKPQSVIKKAMENGRVTPLHCAAINPNPDYLASLLAVSPHYNLPDKNGWQPIHYASVCKGHGPLQLLLSRGAGLHECDTEGNTALHLACKTGRLRSVELVIDHLSSTGKRNEDMKTVASELERANKQSFTPLHLAAQHGHEAVVRVLMKHKTDPEKSLSAAHDKLTPLMLAAQHGYFEVVTALVENGAMVETKDKKQRTALTHAIIDGNAHVASYLLRLGADPNSSDSSGNTLVHYAAAYGWYFCLKLLAEAGASLNVSNNWKLTPLSVAFMKGHIGLVDFLLSQPGVDVNVNLDDGDGMTLLLRAVRSELTQSLLDRVKFLVDKQKCDCSKMDFNGNNALHHLVMAEAQHRKNIFGEEVPDSSCERAEKNEDGRGDCEEMLFYHEERKQHDAVARKVAKLLITNGCDMQAVNKEQETPFSLAIREGSLVLVKEFLQAGCILSVDLNNDNGTILHSLVKQATTDEVHPLVQALLTCKTSNPEIASLVVLQNMGKLYDKDGYTPLLLAIKILSICKNDEGKIRLTDLIQFLLNDIDSDVNAPVKTENDTKPGKTTALHLAALCPSGRVTEMILERKPSLNEMNVVGRTPLLVAVCKGNSHAAVALIRAGADVNVRSVENDNLPVLLLAAKDSKLLQVIKLLVQFKATTTDVEKKTGNTALHYVVTHSEPDVVDTVRALVEGGIDVNSQNVKLQTPLTLAVNSNNGGTDSSVAVEEFLLSHGGKTNIIDFRGRVPLHYAFVKIHKAMDTSHCDPIELVTLLVGGMSNEQLEIQDEFGQTPLHRAAYRGATISCLHLAPRIKNLDVKDKKGNTPLGLAVLNEHEGCALMLLQRGASCVTDVVTGDHRLPGWEWGCLHNVKPSVEQHTILQEAVKKDWQGVLFLMLDQLETMNKGLSLAVEAALKTHKYKLASKLISRVKHGWTLYSDKQSMLHVLAREAPVDNHQDLQIKVAQILIEKGVPAMARDEHGSSVLTYAAINHNHTLCNFFTEMMGMVAVVNADQDKSSRTPFSALFWNIGQNNFSEPIKNWCLSLIRSGATPNMLTLYPIRESPYPGVPCLRTFSLHEERDRLPRLSPLIVAIYKQNYNVVRFLLENGADVNFCDDLLRTPIMHAAKLNDMKMTKLLLNAKYNPVEDKREFNDANFKKTSDVDLTKQDIQGWSVIHHLVAPMSTFSYTNVALLRLLVRLGASLALADTTGLTALQLAARRSAKILVDTIQELLKLTDEDKVPVAVDSFPLATDGVSPPPKPWDYGEDAASFLQKMKPEEDAKEVPTVLPDPCTGLADKGKVEIDEAQNIPYDVLMTVVDLSYGVFGMYNFYKMQIVRQTGKDLIILFTKWGRVGDTGQYQKTPFSTIEEAVKEFCKIFKSKSGNSWDNVKDFHAQPKKYRLVQMDKRRHLPSGNTKIQLESSQTSKLPASLQSLMSEIMDVKRIESSLNKNWKTDLTLGDAVHCLSESSLRKAENLLHEIGQIVHRLKKVPFNDPHHLELTNEIVEMSEEFYQLVPVEGYQYEKLSPFFTPQEIHNKLTLVQSMLQLEVAAKLLLGAHTRTSEINPTDYVYHCLQCRIQPLSPDMMEAQVLLQYLHNTYKSTSKSTSTSASTTASSVGAALASCDTPKVEAIYRVTREDDKENFPKKQLSNHFLLWHGTRTSNLLGILARGLQVAPFDAEITGDDCFGKGVYFADMFATSEYFCTTSEESESKFMLVCEVLLGKVKEVCPEDGADMSIEGFDSLKVLGREEPDPAYSISWHGCTVPLGPTVDTYDSHKSFNRTLPNNEYVIKQPSQIYLRYLLQYK